MAFAHVAQITIVGSQHGSETNNVLCFGTNITPPNWTQVATWIIECIVNNLKPALSSDWTLNRLVVREIFPAIGDALDVVPGTAVAGTGLGALPAFNSALINLYTGGGGRSGRGRVFLPGVITTQVANGRINTASQTPYVNFIICMAAKFINSLDPAAVRDYQWCVLSRKNAGANYANAGTAARPVTKAQLNPVVATMHSRKIGVGS